MHKPRRSENRGLSLAAWFMLSWLPLLTLAHPGLAADILVCNDLVALEPAGMLGTLAPAQLACLEARLLDDADGQRASVSVMLINNAEGKGDKLGWSPLVQRHLEEIDHSDPDLCYKFALHLSRASGAGSDGVSEAKEVIRWADAALANRSNWKGQTYNSRVYALLRLKTEAANTLWQATAAVEGVNPRRATGSLPAGYRDLTRLYAEEWLEFARATGQASPRRSR